MSSAQSPDASSPLPGDALRPVGTVKLGRYRMRFAHTVGDLEAVQRLRYEVFNLELGEGFADSIETGRDVDRFDAQCQHLMVIDTDEDSVVGTYRLQIAESAHEAMGFYSAGEFDLSAIPDEVVAEAVELGRACVAKNHRSRGVLFLLWRGLAKYILHNGKRSFFGCSSLTSQDAAEGIRFYRQLERDGLVHPEIRVDPLPGFECVASAEEIEERPEVPIPTLFHIYLKYGAKVLGPPAIDREFGTIDYLTFLEPHREHLEQFSGSDG